jgi:hypothetical protein
VPLDQRDRLDPEDILACLASISHGLAPPAPMLSNGFGGSSVPSCFQGAFLPVGFRSIG